MPSLREYMLEEQHEKALAAMQGMKALGKQKESDIPSIGDPYPFEKDFTPQCHHLRWLAEHLDGWQFGEQGLIDTLLRSLNLTHGVCIEYGAGDGEGLPVTIDRACQFHQSHCVLVEIDDAKRDKLGRTYPDATVCKTLDWNAKYLDDIGIVVIDIDGSDSVVMREMLEADVRPTLLVVEHLDRNFPIGTSKPDTIPTWMLGHKLQSGHAIQDTAETLHAIAAQNGYERIGFNRCNSFFVVAERYTDLFR